MSREKNQFFSVFPCPAKRNDDKPGRHGLHKEVPGFAPARGEVKPPEKHCRHAMLVRRQYNRMTDNGARVNGNYGVSRMPGVLLIFRTDMDGVSGTTRASSSDSSR